MTVVPSVLSSIPFMSSEPDPQNPEFARYVAKSQMESSKLGDKRSKAMMDESDKRVEKSAETNAVIAGNDLGKRQSIDLSDDEKQMSLSELGIDPRLYGNPDITSASTYAEAERFSAASKELTGFLDSDPVAYSEKLAGLDSKIRNRSQELEKATRKYSSTQKQLKEFEEEQRLEQYTFELEAAQDIEKLQQEKYEAALSEEKAVREISKVTQEKFNDLTEQTLKAFKNEKPPAAPGTFGDLIGFFDDNDDFSAKKTASTVFWLAGTFLNTFLSIGTEGKIPNYFMTAFFKAVASDFKAKKMEASQMATFRAEKRQARQDSLNAVISRFDSTVDQMNVYRGAMLRRFGAAVDQIAAKPELAQFATNPKYQAALSVFKKDIKYEEQLTNYKLASALKDQAIKEVGQRTATLSAASAAQQREHGMKLMRLEMSKALAAPKEKKIAELTTADKEFYTSSDRAMSNLQEALAIVDILERESGDTGRSIDRIVADFDAKKYFPFSIADRLQQNGRLLARQYARTLDKGNLAESEQQFTEDVMGFLARNNLSQIRAVLKKFEMDVVGQTMTRYLLTSETNKPILLPWMSTIGIQDPSKLFKDVQENNLNFEESMFYDNRLRKMALERRLMSAENKAQASGSLFFGD